MGYFGPQYTVVNTGTTVVNIITGNTINTGTTTVNTETGNIIDNLLKLTRPTVFIYFYSHLFVTYSLTFS